MVLRVAVAMVAILLAWPIEPLRAQGFLQQFFGYRPPARLYGYPAVRPYPLYRAPAYWPPYDRPDDGGRAPLGRPDTYRTLCVRLCDGYYYPISSATLSNSFSRDADACSASCGSEARLFYYPNAGGSVETMTDLTGLAYSALPNAFLYRKTLVEGCRCRPEPWSDAELQRHRDYARSKSAPDASAAAASHPR